LNRDLECCCNGCTATAGLSKADLINGAEPEALFQRVSFFNVCRLRGDGEGISGGDVAFTMAFGFFTEILLTDN